MSFNPNFIVQPNNIMNLTWLPVQVDNSIISTETAQWMLRAQEITVGIRAAEREIQIHVPDAITKVITLYTIKMEHIEAILKASYRIKRSIDQIGSNLDTVIEYVHGWDVTDRNLGAQIRFNGDLLGIGRRHDDLVEMFNALIPASEDEMPTEGSRIQAVIAINEAVDQIRQTQDAVRNLVRRILQVVAADEVNRNPTRWRRRQH